MKKFCKQLLCWTLLLLLTSCHKEKSDMEGGRNIRTQQDSLLAKAMTAGMRNDFRRADSLGSIIYERARRDNDLKFMAYGLMVQAYPDQNGNVAAKTERLEKAEQFAIQTGNDSLLANIYNMMGILLFDDFSQSRNYLLKAIHHGKLAGADDYVIRSECNIAELYRMVNDTLGIVHDKNILEYALKKSNDPLLVSSAVRCSEYYIDRPDSIEKALKYIDFLKDSPPFYQHYMMMKYYLAKDELGKAGNEFNILKKLDVWTPGALSSAAILQYRLGNYQQAQSLLQEGLDGYESLDPRNPDKVKLLRLNSDIQERLGDYMKALDYMHQYADARDSLQQIKSLYELNSFKIKYDTEKKELELTRQKAALHSRTLVIGWIVTIALLLIISMAFYIRHRNRLYRIIIEQKQEALGMHPLVEPAEELTEETEDLSEAVSGTDDDITARAAERSEKLDEIWRKICVEMDNRIYADLTITRETFAQKIGCNHTWFSAAIRKFTGGSYTQFMNARRIDEAVKILSNPDIEMTNGELAGEVGFLSQATFYAAFKTRMGMSPAQFRKKAKN